MKISKPLLLILAIALLLRLIYFTNSLTFFYDQARDAMFSMEIFQGDPIKIIGPTSDFPGLHHGPLYWYLIGPIYEVSGGNVYLVRLFLILVNVTAIVFIYDLTKTMFKNEKVALLAGLLFAISFEATQYARWLSNPAPAVLTSIISFWSLYKLIKGKPWALIPLFVSWGLSIQFQLFMLYQIVVFAIIWIAIKGFQFPKTPFKTYVLAIAGLLLTTSTYLVSELKFNFQSSRALLKFFQNQTFFGGSFVSMLQTYLDRLVNIFFLNLWGLNLFLAGLATIITLYLSTIYIKESKHKNEVSFLTLWIISPIIINFFAAPNTNYVNLGASAGVIIISAYFLYELALKRKHLFIIALVVISLGNATHILTKNKNGEVLFTVQSKMLIGDELKVVDWVYKEAEGKPFKLNTITAPLFINSTWAHLFNWYGKTKYGYMPIWWGETQVDVPGSKIAFAKDSETDLHFLIIEPGSTGDDYYTKAIKFLENQRSVVDKKEEIGSFKIEKRKIIKEQTFTAVDAFNVITNIGIGELQKVE